MSRPLSLPKAKPKTRRSATVVSNEELRAWRDLKLCQRAFVGAMIRWLTKHGGAEWKVPP
jgi:hypothetical protein